jgi:hypothetical protein
MRWNLRVDPPPTLDVAVLRTTAAPILPRSRSFRCTEPTKTARDKRISHVVGRRRPVTPPVKSVSRAIQIAPNPNRTNAPRSRSSALPQEIRSPHGSWRSGKPPCRFASREGEKAGGVPQEGASSSAPVPRLAAAVFWHVRGSPITPNPSQASSITALPVPWCAPAAECSTLHTREPCGLLPISALLPSSEGMRSADWTGQHSAVSLSLFYTSHSFLYIRLSSSWGRTRTHRRDNCARYHEKKTWAAGRQVLGRVRGLAVSTCGCPIVKRPML